MVDNVKDLVKKATGFFVRNKSLPRVYWPAGVLNRLEVRYHLKPDDMLRLGYLQRRLNSDGQTYYSVLIYDRLEAEKRQIAIRRFEDIYDYPELFLYKGYLFRNGNAYLTEVTHFETN